MKLWTVVGKTLREQIRSPWELLLVLSLAPWMVLLYWSFFGGGSTTYAVLALNQDAGQEPARQAVQALQAMTYADGQPMLAVRPVEDRATAEALLRDREAQALVILPAGFSAALEDARRQARPAPVPLTLVGDLSNPYYAVAAILSSMAVEQYASAYTGRSPLIAWSEAPLGGSAARTEFELYVPGLLVIGVTLLVFSVAMAVAREVESGTVRRLQLTRMRPVDFLGGISLTYLLVALVTVGLTLLTAQALGFRSLGSLWLAGLITVLTGMGVIGVGLVTACFARTVSAAAIYANFPLVMLMFFSGAVFPVSAVPLFTLGGRSLGLFDLLPTRHAVTALNKVLSLGAGPAEVRFELLALALLSGLYFAAGVGLFHHRHMTAER
jgi:ABC-2 type transport system permease protein